MPKDTIDEIAQSVVSGRQDQVEKLVVQAIDEGLGAQEVLDKGLIAAMKVVG